MRNTIGDDNSNDESVFAEKQIIFMILCSTKSKHSSNSPFLCLGFVLNMFSDFGNFSAPCSYKKVLI